MHLNPAQGDMSVQMSLMYNSGQPWICAAAVTAHSEGENGVFVKNMAG